MRGSRNVCLESDYYRPYSGFAIEMAFRWPAGCGPPLNADFVALRV